MDCEKQIERCMNKIGLSKEKDIKEQLRLSIKQEREEKEKITADKIISRLKNGDFKNTAMDVVMLTRPSLFSSLLSELRQKLDIHFSTSDSTLQRDSALFFIDLTLNLRSFLPNWSLGNKDLYLEDHLKEDEIGRQINENLGLLKKWEKDNTIFQKELISILNKTTKERLFSEDVSKDDLQEIANKVVGESIEHYLSRMFEFIDTSNLKKITQMRNENETLTEIGNDYAAHLHETMLLGASFVTTNPQLAYINFERNLDTSDTGIDDLVSQFLKSKKIEKTEALGPDIVEQFTDIFTSEVVIKNASLLRDLFLLTEGRMGHVCLQVNPLYHGNAEKMVENALEIYVYLYERLGGIPNVVFKLPGTKAGLEVERTLTNIGIGTNITVEFGLFQIIPFVKAINIENTIVSLLTLMDGRMSFPVRDELLSLGVPEAKEAAQWAGVAVGRRAYELLYSRKHFALDPARIKLLIASLRNYDNFFPDITELMGVAIITVFPNIRNQFDH